MIKPEVSVIIPIYNAEGYIINLLKNLIAQTYVNSEFVLVNDGSTDETMKIISDFLLKHKDNRFNVITKKNGGVSSARNYALDNIKGDYVIFVDSDDVFTDNFIESYVNSIQKHNSGMEFFSAIRVLDDNKRTVIGKIDYEPISSEKSKSVFEMIENFASLQAWGYPFTFISKSSLWKDVRFDEEISYQEDVLALFTVWINNPKLNIFVNKEAFYYYVQRRDSALHSMSVEDNFQFVQVDDILLKMLVENDFPKELYNILMGLRVSSLMSIIASSIVLNDNKNYLIARKEFIKDFKIAKIPNSLKKRRYIQFILLQLNFKFVLKVIYKRIYNKAG